MNILCATANTVKFNIGKHALARYNIELLQTAVEIDEIQHVDPLVIVTHKAKQAFLKVNQPVIVTDDCWSVVALNGFPGGFMKYINDWFSPQDFLNLMSEKSDRTIYLEQYVAYCDGGEPKVFFSKVPGKIIHEARGQHGVSIMKVVCFDDDNGLTASETYDQGLEHDEVRLASRSKSWQELAQWLVKEKA